jgi:MFS family permease
MVVSVLGTIVVVDKVGRKTLMLFGAGALAVIYAIEGYCFQIGAIGIHIIILTLASVAIYSFTLAPVMWVILSEIYPNRIRGTAMSLVAVAIWVGNFSLTFSFPAINQSLGWPLSFWLYGVICLVGFVVMVVFLPETKGKSLEEIEKQLFGSPGGQGMGRSR